MCSDPIGGACTYSTNVQLADGDKERRRGGAEMEDVMPLEQIPYNSGDDLVRWCLARKRYHALNTHGIGPASCCAAAETTVRGQRRYVFGNSQLRMPIQGNIYANPWMRCHGEASAMMQVIERCQHDLANNEGNLAALIPRIYIELSPCGRCEPMLANVAPDLPVLYSFRHPGQVGEWEEAARVLCSP